MVVCDTSTIVAFLAGKDGADVERFAKALDDRLALLAPVVIAELMSAENGTKELAKFLAALPCISLLDGYWFRVGALRREVLANGIKARLTDSLIAQSCIDHRVPLITRDRDFRHFVAAGGLILAE